MSPTETLRTIQAAASLIVTHLEKLPQCAEGPTRRYCLTRLPKKDGLARPLYSDVALWLNHKITLCQSCAVWSLALLLENEARVGKTDPK